MRRRAVQLVMVATWICVVLLGVPLLVVSTVSTWQGEQSRLDDRAESLAYTIERRVNTNEPVTEAVLSSAKGGKLSAVAHVRVDLPTGQVLDEGKAPTGHKIVSTALAGSGAKVRLEIPASPVIRRIAVSWLAILAVVMLCLLTARAMALRVSRRISAPLIYLAAQAEQIGSGQVQARVRPSEIEEIDLVQAELARTGERIAGRLAAERQFAADASHQLRTPLTALSMRLEEIEMIAEQEEVQEEARICLEQIERLTGVVTDLLKTSRQGGGGTTVATHLSEIYYQQLQEWELAYQNAGRKLVMKDEAGLSVLVTPGSLSQALATIIENSLKYGAGTTSVTSRPTANGRGVIIEIADEGEGVDDELAPDVFDKHVSGKGGTGLGLALAKDLVQADGGRVELTQRRPPIFAISVNAVPQSLDPEKVLPPGALVSVGRRNRMF